MAGKSPKRKVYSQKLIFFTLYTIFIIVQCTEPRDWRFPRTRKVLGLSLSIQWWTERFELFIFPAMDSWSYLEFPTGDRCLVTFFWVFGGGIIVASRGCSLKILRWWCASVLDGAYFLLATKMERTSHQHWDYECDSGLFGSDFP